MPGLNEEKLSKWQFDLIKRLPAPKEVIEKILREEYSVDFEGNPISNREIVNISRKKKRSHSIEIAQVVDTDYELKDAP